MSPTTATEHAPRIRSAAALARAVVRDLAEQDAGPGEGLTPTQQIRAWRRDSTNAGDRVIVDALDLLGEVEAARVYAIGPRAGYLFAAERARLHRAAARARGQ